MNQPTSITTSSGTVSYRYDESGKMITETDAKDKSISYTYDSNGQLTSMTDARNNTWRYFYDTNGNLISQIDTNGKTWAYPGWGMPFFCLRLLYQSAERNLVHKCDMAIDNIIALNIIYL
jgi:YD repeat-containing protein